MSESVQSSLRAETLDVEDLVTRVRAGEVRVPAFQRGLRWNYKDVQRLFESIARGYPIGNLLLWQHAADASQLQIGALHIEARATDRALFVVDGQQRLTSLANALSREAQDDPRFQLSYDLNKQDFVRFSPDGPAQQIPLPVLFDLAALLRWFTSHPSLQEDPTLIERANTVAKRIRQFRVPVYIVEQSDESVLRDIFDRMNNYGKQLTRAEVFSALNEQSTGERDPDDPGSYARIAEQLHASTGFGLLDDNTVFMAFLARRGPDVTREIRSEFEPQGDRQVIDRSMEAESRADAFDGALLALRRAIDFLQSEASIPHLAFLPYRYILVVLARFFAHHPEPSSATRRDLRRWLWRAALGGPSVFKGSATGATRALASRIDIANETRAVAALLDAVSDVHEPDFRLPVFKTNHASTRIALCALWAAKPRKLESDGLSEPFSFEDLALALDDSATAVGISARIIPPGLLPDELRSAAGNRTLLPNLGAPLTTPEVLAGATRAAFFAANDADSRAVLESHVISSEAAAALQTAGYTRFVEIRQRDIEQHTARFLRSRGEWGWESTPPLASLVVPDDEDDEDALRDDPLEFGLT